MFAVGTRIPTHARELGPDLIDQVLLLFPFGDGEGSLQNVIYKSNRQTLEQVALPTGRLTGKLILHHGYNRTDAVLFGGHDLFDQQTSTLVVGGNEGLLANVGSELVAGHVQHLTAELGDH